jgi:hypothetical protein
MSHKLLKNNLKLKFYLVCSFLLLLTITLIVLPGNYFDNGNSKCVSVLLFDKQCYGCGMTRAIQHLIHFDFKIAYDYNKLSFIVFPLFVFLSLFEIRKMYLSLIEETEI